MLSVVITLKFAIDYGRFDAQVLSYQISTVALSGSFWMVGSRGTGSRCFRGVIR